MPKSVPDPYRAYRIVAFFLRPPMIAMTRRDWRGVENLPRAGGVIVASNHMTNIDPLTFAQFLYDNGRPPKILAKASLWKVPVVRWIVRSTGQIPVTRGSAGAAGSIQPAVEALRAGECVAVFPEGTLTREPNLWPMMGKTGVARLALESGAPVIPVAQWGPQKLLGRYSKRLRPFPRKTITIVAGPPVDLSEFADCPRDAATMRAATEKVMAAITSLLADLRGEQPPAERYDMRKHPEAREL